MSHAELCPVCEGAGSVPNDCCNINYFTLRTRICHGCGGCGWVVVPGEYIDEGDENESW